MTSSPRDDNDSPAQGTPGNSHDHERGSTPGGEYTSSAPGSEAQPGGQPDPGPYPCGAPSWGQSSSEPYGHPHPYGQSNPNGQAGGDRQASPYGQPNPYGAAGQYGQPSSGQPGYGQPDPNNPFAGAGQSQAGAMELHPQKPRRPRTLWTAQFLMIAAALGSLAWGIYAAVFLSSADLAVLFSPEFVESFTDELAADPAAPDLSPADAEAFMVQALGGMAIGWGLFMAALHLTMAFVGTLAGQPGRIIATIWLATAPLAFVTAFTPVAALIIAVVVVMSIAALVLLWLPASNKYIRHRRSYKQAVRSGYARS